MKQLFKRFIQLPYPEKLFVLRHPFIIRKIWEITTYVQKIAATMAQDPALDSDANGGQVDAFRHAFCADHDADYTNPKI